MLRPGARIHLHPAAAVSEAEAPRRAPPPPGHRLGAALVLALVWTSGAIMAHPLPADAAGHHALHCDHPGLAALTHLFCFRSAHAADRDVCPHARRA